MAQTRSDDRFKVALPLQGKTILIALPNHTRLPMIIRVMLCFAIANGATCSLACAALFSGIVWFAVETPPFPEANAAMQNAVASMSSSDCSTIKFETTRGQESGGASVYTTDEPSHHECSVSDGEDKNKRHSVQSQERVHRWPDFPARVSTVRRMTLQHDVIWASSHGHQLQLYNSGDEADASTQLSHCRKTFLRPPCKQMGGLFYALKSLRRSAGSFWSQHARTAEPASPLMFGCSVVSTSTILTNKWTSHIAAQSCLPKPFKRWLVHQALLL